MRMYWTGIVVLLLSLQVNNFLQATSDLRDEAYSRQILSGVSNSGSAIDLEEIRTDLFSPTGLVGQIGQNFLAFITSAVLMTALIPFNLAGGGNEKKRRRRRRSESLLEEGDEGWSFSFQHFGALMRAMADVADNYKRYTDEL
eukprot:TRINITY_DN3714_c0_g1_i1.p1 TRINITY_DN3714_c0_g1~~TRINITY_DN3714_c0_g1_i1.p1  ORF type:complete len:143 (+),score=22.18 TRINITY_DN3714_c0_g1_i1:56-484(+)